MPSVIQKFYTDNLALCQKAAKHSLKRKKDVNVSSKQQTLLKDFGKMCLPETFFYFFLIKDEIQIADWRDERDEKTSTHSHTHTHTRSGSGDSILQGSNRFWEEKCNNFFKDFQLGPFSLE